MTIDHSKICHFILFKGILMIKIQLRENIINSIECEIKKFNNWWMITKSIHKNRKEVFDEKRTISELLFNSESPACINEFIKEIKSCTEMIDSKLVAQSLASLCSKPKGPKEIYYSEYDNPSIANLEEGRYYHSCTFSFNRAARILVKDNQGKEIKMKIPCGYVLIWNYTVIHAGESYDNLKYQLLFKLGSKENEFPFRKDAYFKLTTKCEYCKKNFSSKKTNEKSTTDSYELQMLTSSSSGMSFARVQWRKDRPNRIPRLLASLTHI